MAIRPNDGTDTGAGNEAVQGADKTATREQIHITTEAQARVKQAFFAGAILPVDAPCEEILAYHHLSRDLAKQNLQLQDKLMERRPIADESSARRQALSKASTGHRTPCHR